MAKFGWRVSIPLLLLCLGGLVWWRWSDIQTRPYVREAIEWTTPIPHAPPDKFTVAVVHLEGDPAQENERLLLSDLESFRGLAVLPINRTVSLSRGGTEDQDVASANTQAQELLRQSGAQALIWGSVLRHDGKSALELHWTTTEGYDQGTMERYIPDANLDLPPVFWTDLTQIIGLIIHTRLSLFLQATGTYQAQDLRPFISSTRDVLNSESSRWSPDGRASVEFALAYGLYVVGLQTGDGTSLRESIRFYSLVEQVWTVERDSPGWAVTQNNMGNAFAVLGETEAGTSDLVSALKCFQGALQVQTRERQPMNWATTQNNLGNALLNLGKRESDPHRFREAIAAYQLALQVRQRSTAPFAWAQTENNYGDALVALGAAEENKVDFAQAVAAYQAALEVRREDQVPLDWAQTQNNLGEGLRRLGEQERGTDNLSKAVDACRRALSVRTEERTPLLWAQTESDLGTALAERGSREHSTADLNEAIDHLRAAITERTEERTPFQWAETQNALGGALGTLGGWEQGTEHLEEAVSAFRAALRERTRKATPLDWAQTQNNLGISLSQLAARESSAALWAQAETAFESALSVPEMAQSPDGTVIRQNLAVAKRLLGHP